MDRKRWSLKIWWKLYKNYDKNSDTGYILEVDIEYPKGLHKLHSDLAFLPEKNKN